MATSRAPTGISHPTVVPENFDPEDGASERGDEGTAGPFGDERRRD